MFTCPANIQDLILLAWLASHEPHRNAVIQPDGTLGDWPRRKDRCLIILDLVERELRRLDQCTEPLCPLLIQLLRHQAARIQELHVEYALCGRHGVFFQCDARSSSVLREQRDAFAALSETQVLCLALQENPSLCTLLLTQLPNSDDSELLRNCITSAAQTAVPTTPGDFLLTEWLRVSLSEIDWKEIAKVLTSSSESSTMEGEMH